MARILIVDHEPDATSAFGRSFERSGHDVLRAASGEEAIAIIEAEHPALVLLDVELPDMLEVELKSVVDDVERRRANVERAGATLVYAGRLEDRRWDTPDRALFAKDHVLRVRTYRNDAGVRAELDWKGPTRREGGYKLRDELETSIGEPDALAEILAALGYEVSIAIDREIVQYDLEGTMIRFERYPRMRQTMPNITSPIATS